MSRLAVLHVTECYAGGVRRAMESLVGELPEIDHHVLWSGTEGAPDDNQPYVSVAELPKAPPAAVSRIRTTIERVKPDVVHAHSSWAGLFARALPSRVPVIYQPHCYKFDDPALRRAPRALIRMAEKALAPRAAVTVVLSPHEDRLAKSLRHSMKTAFVPNIASVRPDLDTPGVGFDAGNRVMMIGRLSAQKDPEFFLDVALEVRKRRPETVFRWVGDGDPAMRAHLEAAGIEVTGWINGAELISELAQPSLYLHTARYEGFPLSILEAAAFEHPLVARTASAFDGLNLPGGSTAQSVATVVVEALDPGSRAAGEATDAARRINESMSRSAHRNALLDMYREFEAISA